MAAYLHTNNIKMMVQMNAITNVTPASADAWIADLAGGSPQPWTNGFGTIPVDAFGPYSLVSTPDTAQNDMNQLMYWGVDAVNMEFCNGSNGDYRQSSYAWGRALLYMRFPVGWNQTNTPVTFQTQDLSLMTYLSTNQYVPLMLPTSFVLGRDKPPVFIAFENIALGEAFDARSKQAAYINKYNQTGSMYDNSNIGNGAAALRTFMSDFAGTTKATQGAYISWLGLNQHWDFVERSITHGFPVVGYTNDTAIGSGWDNFLLYETNSTYTRVEQDPQQNWPVLAVDNGTNLVNGSSVWVTKLWNGNYAAAFCNESTNIQTVSATFAQMGIPTNATYHVYTILSGRTPIDLGNMSSGTVTSQSLAPPSFDGNNMLFMFDYVPNVFGNGSVASGLDSFAFGTGSSATGQASIAGGYQSQAKGTASMAIGYQAITESTADYAFGNGSTANGSGNGAFAAGQAAHALAPGAFEINADNTFTHKTNSVVGSYRVDAPGGIVLNGNVNPSSDGAFSLGGLDGNTATRFYDVTASHTVSGQFIHASGAYVFGVDVGLTTSIYSTNALGHGVKMNFEGGILTSTNSL